ncbi:hypothetical protein ACFVOK_34165 [Streptomyces sp. NPDC057798]|uniref:hypothetical protein n=1 Tax=Streptomyces sp. NPDC057798 TaxID=3346252 RepID=UPI0036AD733F
MRRVLTVCLLAVCALSCRGTEEAASTPSPSATMSSCARQGAIRWTGYTSEHALIAVSPVVEVAEDDGPVAFPLLHVREVVPRLDASEPVHAERIFQSLEKREGLDLARPGTTSATQERQGFQDVDHDGAGQFVSALSVRRVEADFTFDCAGTAKVHGHVTTWHSGAGASLECGHTNGSSKWSRWTRQAYDLACSGTTSSRSTA